MTNNEKTRFIYIRSLKQKFPCSEEQYHAFYKEADRIRHREQYNHHCKCPKKYIWACDGDCEFCEHHIGSNDDPLSLDEPQTEDGDTLGDLISDDAPSIEAIIGDQILLEQLIKRYRELDPDADRIIQMRLDDPKISDRAIAKALGRPQRTFADQQKRINTELRRLLK